MIVPRPSRAGFVGNLVGTWAVTTASVGAYAFWVNGRQALTEYVEGWLEVVLFASVTSAVAVYVLARVRFVLLAVLATSAAGCIAAYVVGSLTYGSEGELQNGLVFRAIGGAVLGAISGVAAWVVGRSMLRQHVRRTTPLS